MSDACCGPPPEGQQSGEPESGPEKLWQVHELQMAVAWPRMNPPRSSPMFVGGEWPEHSR